MSAQKATASQAWFGLHITWSDRIQVVEEHRWCQRRRGTSQPEWPSIGAGGEAWCYHWSLECPLEAHSTQPGLLVEGGGAWLEDLGSLGVCS